MNEVNVQRNYKDSFFRMLFKDRENLLSLYNALNKTGYTDVDGLEITTLENAVYMNYKNDVSFVFDYELMLYEHQSTVNPNMPLRDLFYVTDILQKRTYNKDLYSSKLIPIPAPRFVVFYNGMDYQPERQTLKLSDAYEKWQENPELELTVTMYNINQGCNKEIMDACRTLKEYAMYVERVRTYAKQMPLKEAVERAINECIEEGILADFLRENRAEAIKVSIYEYDEELHFKTLRDEGYESGYEAGMEQGKSCLNKLYAILIESDRLDDLKHATQDRAYQEQLMLELLPGEIQNI
ncbi:MAG: hypothetical protein J1F41_11480 [Lachnospiraceae bacterium]|nr:hypothetical protein [Lachnospiraceae bacterium]